MDLLRKKLLPTGEYIAPQGVYSSEPNRARQQVEKFRQLKAEGYKFPIPWGHRLSAVPQYGTVSSAEYQNALEQRAFEEARYNAGYVEDLDIDEDGTLQITLPAPPGYRVDHTSGDLVNEADGTRVREVSGAFGDWTDGKGRTHKDILIHAALCVRPVWGTNQPGFELATGNQTTLATGSVRYTHTLSTRVGGSSMAKEEDDLDLEGLDDDASEPGTESEPAEDLEAPDDVEPVKVKNPDMFEQAIGLLNQAGLQLPGHITEENFCEHLITALTQAISMGAKFERADSKDEVPPPVQTQTTDQPPSPEAPPIMMATVAKQSTARLAEYGLQKIRPIMLSTDDMSPREKVWAEKESRRTSKRIAGIYRECRDKWGLPKHIADREAAKCTVVQLSFLPNGDVVPPPDLHTAILVREILQTFAGVNPAELTTLATRGDITTAANPLDSAMKLRGSGNTAFAERMLQRVTGDKEAKLAQVR